METSVSAGGFWVEAVVDDCNNLRLVWMDFRGRAHLAEANSFFSRSSVLLVIYDSSLVIATVRSPYFSDVFFVRESSFSRRWGGDGPCTISLGLDADCCPPKSSFLFGGSVLHGFVEGRDRRV